LLEIGFLFLASVSFPTPYRWRRCAIIIAKIAHIYLKILSHAKESRGGRIVVLIMYQSPHHVNRYACTKRQSVLAHPALFQHLFNSQTEHTNTGSPSRYSPIIGRPNSFRETVFKRP
jgi:hypothetical protein